MAGSVRAGNQAGSAIAPQSRAFSINVREIIVCLMQDFPAVTALISTRWERARHVSASACCYRRDNIQRMLPKRPQVSSVERHR